jgi:ribosomal protein S1
MKQLKIKIIHETKTGVLLDVNGSRCFISKYGCLYQIIKKLVQTS